MAGTIIIEDALARTRRAVAVDQVPEDLAWVEVAGERVEVVHILLSGAGRRRAVTLFGQDERLLLRMTAELPEM